MNTIELNKDTLTKGVQVKLTTGPQCPGHTVHLIMAGETLFVSEEDVEQDRLKLMTRAWLDLENAETKEEFEEVYRNIHANSSFTKLEKELIVARYAVFFPPNLRNMATEAQRKWVLGEL